MSSCPGYTLERFLMWNYNLIVDGDGGANVSREMAEALGLATHRRDQLSANQFAPLVALFETHRADIEEKLHAFDDQETGWRQYASYGFDFIPDETYEAGAALLKARSQP